MSFKIDKGIPAPFRLGRRCKYPIAELDVGDSFLVPVEEPHVHHAQNSLLGCTRKERAKGKRFATSKVEGGVRIWRIA